MGDKSQVGTTSTVVPVVLRHHAGMLGRCSHTATEEEGLDLWRVVSATVPDLLGERADDLLLLKVAEGKARKLSVREGFREGKPLPIHEPTRHSTHRYPVPATARHCSPLPPRGTLLPRGTVLSACSDRNTGAF